MPKELYYAVAVAAIALVTFGTRALPFALFSRRAPPRWLGDAARLLPACVMTILALASFKDLDFSNAPWGLREIGAALLVAVLHLGFRQALLSIFGGTALYMLSFSLF
jgi:branched-subunit amino acid transport protein AzlD